MSHHSYPTLSSWPKITKRIEYKLLSLTYKVLTTTQPPYLHNLISVQPPRSTRSSSLVTLAQPPTSSSLRITDRSFRYMLHHVSGIYFLVLSVNLIPVPLSLTCLLLLLPHLLTLSSYHSHHQLLPLSFTLSSRPISFTNLSQHRLFSDLRTVYSTRTSQRDRFF